MLKRLLFVVLMLLAFAAQAVVYSSPFGPKPQWVDANGAPMVSGTLLTYVGGSSTPQVTYTDQGGGTANPTTITLNSRGETPNELWLTGGVSYKFVLKDSSGVTVWTIDNISGINDTTGSQSEWITGPAPTYVSATSFTLAGDQTATFHVGRRLKTTNSGGTVYSTITSSVFGASTTVTVLNDASSLDSGLSAVSYGLLAKSNDSMPRGIFPTMANARGQVFGATLSNNVADAVNDIDVAPGVAIDSTGVDALTLASALTKQLDAAWAVGTNAGGRMSAAAIANTTYHVFLIKRVDTQVVDVGFDTSPTAPTMPANYTLFRRIGSIIREGGAIVGFVQDGDLFYRKVPISSVNTTNPGSSAVTATLNVPTGINVEAIFSALLVNGTTTNEVAYFSDLATTDAAANYTSHFSLIGPGTASANSIAGGEFRIRTNTSAQIRYRLSAGGAADVIRLATKGWIDTRGGNS